MRAKADYLVPENKDDLLDKSESALRITALNNVDEHIEYTQDKTSLYGYTLTEVEVNKVFSGDDTPFGKKLLYTNHFIII